MSATVPLWGQRTCGSYFSLSTLCVLEIEPGPQSWWQVFLLFDSPCWPWSVWFHHIMPDCKLSTWPKLDADLGHLTWSYVWGFSTMTLFYFLFSIPYILEGRSLWRCWCMVSVTPSWGQRSYLNYLEHFSKRDWPLLLDYWATFYFSVDSEIVALHWLTIHFLILSPG